MQTNFDDGHLLPVLLVWLEFLALALLGFLLVQLIQWDTVFRDRQALWLGRVRQGARQLRAIRRQLEKTGGDWPPLPLPMGLARKWRVVNWVGRAVFAANRARS